MKGRNICLACAGALAAWTGLADETYLAAKTYVRVTFEQKGDATILQLGELGVFDADGNRVNLNLTQTTSGADPAGMAASTFSLSRSVGNPGGQGPAMLFDGDTGTKWCCTGAGTMSKATPSTWIAVTMRLAVGCATPVSYNFATGNDAVGRSPTYWFVEVSKNGTDWTEVDRREPGSYPSATYTWFNGGTPYAFSGAFDFRSFDCDAVPSVVCTGSAHHPKPAVRDAIAGTALVEGTDFDYSWGENILPGTGTVTVTGCAGTRYAGVTDVLPFTIESPSFSVSVEDAWYDGFTPVTPAVTVTDATTGAPLTNDVHYTFAYSDNEAVGTGRVTVTGKAGSLYAGVESVKTFAISAMYYYHVAPEATGGGTGLSWDSPMTVAEAVAVAGAHDRIWLKSGVYSNACVSVGTTMTLKGGYAGDEASPAVAPHGDGLSVFDGCATNASTGVATVLTLAAGAGVAIDLSRIEVRRAKSRGVNVTLGAGSVSFHDCRFYDNGYATGGASGRGIYASGTSASRLAFEDCDFTENRHRYNGSSGGPASLYGQALYLTGVGRTDITGTLFLRNGLIPSAGWRLTEGRNASHGMCLYAANSPLVVSNCDFVANIGLLHQNPHGDGGTVCLSGNSASSFVSCRFLGNTTPVYEAYYSGDGGATFGLYTTAGTLTTFDLCTFAYNTGAAACATAFTQVTGDSSFRNCIFYANCYRNTTAGCADVSVQSGTCTMRNCRVSDLGTASLRCASDATLDLSDMTTDDPGFALSQEDFLATYITGGTLTGIDAYQPWKDSAMDLYGKLDCHLRSRGGRYCAGEWVKDGVNSTMLDAATADTPYANEPAPNGERANLGGYGNTAEASKTPNARPAVESVTEDQETDVGTVFYRLRTSGDGEYAARVYFCRGEMASSEAGTNGWDSVTLVAAAVSIDETVDISLGEYVEKGASWAWRVVLVTSKYVVSRDGTTTAKYDLPFPKGRAGPANVIHVWGGATGTGTGADWWNACTSLADAFSKLAQGKSEIWIAGDLNVAASASPGNIVSCKVRGGFSTNAFECAAADRAADAVATVAATNGTAILNGSSSAAFACERVVFRGGTAYGVLLSGAVPYAFTDCAFADTRTTGYYIHALGLSGASSADITRCRFTGNYSTSSTSGQGSGAMQGAALWLDGCTVARVTDCQFVTNGVSPTMLHTAPARDISQVGVTFHLSGTKAYVTNCVFAANRSVSHTAGKMHGMVGIWGSGCHGTVFSHCRFLANGFANWSDSEQTDTHSATVAICTQNATVSFEGCTFAYNVYNSASGSAGILSTSGLVKVKDSIFWGNFRTATSYLNLKIFESATAEISYTLFDATNGTGVAEAEGAITWGPGILVGDPRFGSDFETVRADMQGSTAGTNVVTASSSSRFLGTLDIHGINLHVASPCGYVDEQTGRFARVRGRVSPAIDAADPATDWSREPSGNGRRANLGCWGGTPWAERTDAGLRAFVR